MLRPTFSRKLLLPLLLPLIPAAPLPAATPISPKDGETIRITEPESAPVHGETEIGNVTVTITAAGEISTSNQPAIAGDGENWSIDNSGKLSTTGQTGATLQITDGAFTNKTDARISWQNDSVSLSTDNGEESATAIRIDSWSRNSENLGEILAIADQPIEFTTNNSSFSLTALHLGAREKSEEDAPLTFKNSGNISAAGSGELSSTGTGNELRITGLLLEEFEKIDNSGTIEATSSSESDDFPAGNNLSVTGILALDGAEITNRPGANIRATNESNGSATAISLILEEPAPIEPEPVDPDGEPDDDDGEEPAQPRSSIISNSGTISARASENGEATAILSKGRLTLSNSGTIEAGGIILNSPESEDDEIETAPVGNATAIHVSDGDADITNRGTISAQNGTAILLEKGGTVRNHSKIIGDVFLGADEDATFGIAPTSEIDGTVDAGGGTNTLELMSGNNPFAWSEGEYDGSFSNFSKLSVNANNTIWTLTGDQEYTDGTTISAGALITTDKLTSDLSILDRGTLITTGSIVGNLTSTGDLLVGALDENRNHIAPEGGVILHVDGNISLENGSYVQLIAGETSIEATGDVTIGSADPENEAAKPVVALVNAEWDEDYLIIKGNSITGEFDGGSGFILLDLTYADDSVYAALGINREAIRDAGSSANERSLARVLADLKPVAGSDLETAFRDFAYTASSGNFGHLTGSMNGEIIASGAAAHSSFNRTVRQTIINQIQHRPSIYDDRFAPPPGTPAEEIRDRDRHLWGRILTVRGDLDRPDSAGDADYRLHGIVAGYDTVWTEDSRAGFAAAIGDSRVSHGSDKIDGNVYQTILYASKQAGDFLYDATLGYGFHDMKSRRNVTVGTNSTSAGGSYNGHELFGSFQVTMLHKEEEVLLLPMAGIDFSHFRQQSFRESGTWGLSAGSTDLSSARPFAGLRILADHVTKGGGAIVPEIRFRYSYELLDTDARFSAGFAGDTNGARFSTRGAKFNSGEFETGVGFMFEPGGWDGIAIFGDYDYSVQRQHALSIGMNYRF